MCLSGSEKATARLLYGLCNSQRFNLLPEKFLDFSHHFHKPVHFGLGVVKIKTRAGGRSHFVVLKTGFQIQRRENAGRW